MIAQVLKVLLIVDCTVTVLLILKKQTTHRVLTLKIYLKIFMNKCSTEKIRTKSESA